MSSSEPVQAHSHPKDSAQLIEFLAERDASCPLCGYNLRGLTSDACPECGKRLRLTVGLAEPFLRAWVMLAVAMFSAGGVGILLFYIVVKEGWTTDLPIAPSIYFMIAIPGSMVAVSLRRGFLRLAKQIQIWIGWIALFATAVAFALFFRYIH